MLPFFFKNALTTLNSHMSTAGNITPFIASVNTTKPLIQKKLMGAYSEVVNYLLKMFTAASLYWIIAGDFCSKFSFLEMTLQ